MEVLILNPPVRETKFTRDGRCQSEENTWLSTFPPATFASVAGAIREKYRTKVVDCIGSNITFEECKDIIQSYGPEFVIINSATPTIYSDLETARMVKEVSNASTIFYGEHVTFNYKSLLRHYPNIIDYIVRGEPETL